MTDVLMRIGEDIGTCRGEGHVTQRQIRVAQPKPRNTKDCQEPPASKRQGRIFPSRLPREHGLANTLIFEFRDLELIENKFLLF